MFETKTKYIIKDKTLFVPYDFNEDFKFTHDKMKNINTLIFSEIRVRCLYSVFNKKLTQCQTSQF